jgi:glycosyltransferase involved in cell wall biosynthesis
MSVAYLSASDPNDKRSWSGIHNSIAETLRKHVGPVTALGPWQPEALIRRGRITSFIRRKLTGKRTDYLHTLRLGKAYARHFDQQLQRTTADCVFAVAASTELAFLETKLPVYYVADATFANMIDYYPFYTGLTAASVREGHELQKRALEKSKQLFFPSHWAADSAMKDYGIPSNRIHVIPFGANLDEAPPQTDVSKTAAVNLLFIGVEWQRKGGPVAVEALHELLRRGIDARLTIVGSSPEIHHERITIIPFLNKNNPAERRKLNDLFAAADFFVLPTTAECYGIVFCEASAFGVPSLATRTGGIPGAITEGVNGYMLEPASTGKHYADRIQQLLADDDVLPKLKKYSLEKFRSDLNWNVWGQKVAVLISAAQSR